MLLLRRCVPECTLKKGEPLIIKDDYGRIEVALNQDSFAKNHEVKIGDDFVIEKR